MKTMPKMVLNYIFCLTCLMLFIVTAKVNCLEEQIKKYAFNTNGLGTYSFEYETTGGSYRREDGGILKQSGVGSLVVRGEYGYIDPGGNFVSVKYVADANGFHPILHEDDVRFNDRRII